MGLYILEKNNLAHGDLHTQNILYYSLSKEKGTKKGKDKEKDKYIKYNLDGDNYELKHFKKIFVLWDFGKMKEIGTKTSHRTDWLKERDFPHFHPINCIYWDLCIFTDSLEYFLYKINLKYSKINEFINYLRTLYLSYTIRFINKSNGKDKEKPLYSVKNMVDKLINDIKGYFNFSIIKKITKEGAKDEGK